MDLDLATRLSEGTDWVRPSKNVERETWWSGHHVRYAIDFPRHLGEKHDGQPSIERGRLQQVCLGARETAKAAVHVIDPFGAVIVSRYRYGRRREAMDAVPACNVARLTVGIWDAA